MGQGGLVKQLTGRLLQRLLETEMTAHLGYEKDARAMEGESDRRNG